MGNGIIIKTKKLKKFGSIDNTILKKLNDDTQIIIY